MHLFSLYYSDISVHDEQSTFVLYDGLLCRRIARVLRLRVGQELVLFDRSYNSRVRIEQIEKEKAIHLCVILKERNILYTPPITVLLPLLKRDALEQAVGGLVACGVQSIQLVITDTTQRLWNGQREYMRLANLVISAAEQSRNYAFPILEKPCSLQEALEHHNTSETYFMYADPNGQPIHQLCAIEGSGLRNVLLTVGPEADFSLCEKKLFSETQACAYRLTPTVLRSSLAVTLFAGICRSLFS